MEKANQNAQIWDIGFDEINLEMILPLVLMCMGIRLVPTLQRPKKQIVLRLSSIPEIVLGTCRQIFAIGMLIFL